MNFTLTNLIFIFFGMLSVASAIMVIIQKNIMHSVMYLAFTVLSISGVFFALQAEYLGAVQILVYAGGIVVLYIFVIIIVNMNEVVVERRKLFPKLFIFGMPVLLLGELISIILTHRISFKTIASNTGNGVTDLAQMLLSTYVIPFEIASILLLAVLVGAIIIARRKLLHDSN